MIEKLEIEVIMLGNQVKKPISMEISGNQVSIRFENRVVETYYRKNICPDCTAELDFGTV